MIYVSLFGINLLILYMRFLKKKSGTYFLDFPSGPEYQVTSGCGGIPAQCLWYKWFNPVSFGQILRLSLPPYAFSTHGSVNTSFIINPIASVVAKLRDLEGSLVRFREGRGFGHVVAGRAHNLLKLIATVGCNSNGLSLW
jgi:hypothetical protein